MVLKSETTRLVCFCRQRFRRLTRVNLRLLVLAPVGSCLPGLFPSASRSYFFCVAAVGSCGYRRHVLPLSRVCCRANRLSVCLTSCACNYERVALFLYTFVYVCRRCAWSCAYETLGSKE